MQRIFLSIIFFLVSAQVINAAHLKGGYIEYRYLGPTPNNPGFGRFAITVYQYLDCESMGGQLDLDIYIGIFDAGNRTLNSTLIIPLSNTKTIQKSSFRCIDNPPLVCYRIDSYETITDIQLNRNGYILTVQRCCRINGIENISGSSNSGVTYSVKVNADSEGTSFISNSSPVFAQEDTALVCANNGFTFPFKATDPDLDSLVYSFTSGLNTPSRDAKPLPPNTPPFPPLTYASIFNPGQPMGPNVTIDPRTGIISGIAPATPGQYVVAVLVEEYRAGQKIAEARKEIHITVGNCTIPKAVLPIKIVNCDNFLVAFENLSPASSINSYLWDFGVPGTTKDTSTLAKPIYTYPDSGTFKVKLVINREGVCPDSTSTEAIIYPGFMPAFTSKGVCKQLPYQFFDNSQTTYGTVNSWKWDFGDPAIAGDTSIIKNPVYSYSQVGSYTVMLKVSSNKGCEDTVSSIIQVLDKQVIQLDTRDTLICSQDSLQLNAIGAGNYSWTPNYNIINAIGGSPIVFPKTTTTYHVFLENQGCISTDSVKVNVVDFVTLVTAADTTICLTDGIILGLVSNAPKFLWSSSATLNNPLLKNPLATPVAAQTNYTVQGIMGNCSAVGNIVVNTLPYPIVNAGNDTTVCFAEAASLHGISNGSSIFWSPAALVQNSNSLITKASPLKSQQFVLTASNNTGCTKPISDTMLVTVLPKIFINAGNDTSLVVDQPMQLNGTTDAVNYSWSPSFGLSNNDLLNPVLRMTPVMVAGAGDYLIYTLTGNNQQGCTVSDELVIRLFNTGPSIFVPNGFTPNGDGLNDVIKPILAGIRTLDYFRVYNRYGQLIFETRQEGRGWDGRLNGQLQATAAFVFDCQAQTYLNQPIRKKGNFVLVR